MKKRSRLSQIITTVIALGLVLSISAYAEEDYSSYSFDELLNIKESVEEELLTRPEYEGLSLPEGQYIAGTDLPVGSYEISLNQVDTDYDYVEYYVYETNDMYKYDVDRLFLGDMPLKQGDLNEGSSVTVDLYEGYCLVAYKNGLNVHPSGILNGSPNDGYEVPEGTAVPVGYYTVGADIPEGTYNVYYGGKASSRVGIYDEMKDAQNDYNHGLTSVVVSSTNTSGRVSLKTDQILKVEYNDVVMTKSEALTF